MAPFSIQYLVDIARAEPPLFVEVDAECHERTGFRVLAEWCEQGNSLAEREFGDPCPPRHEQSVERQEERGIAPVVERKPRHFCSAARTAI